MDNHVDEPGVDDENDLFSYFRHNHVHGLDVDSDIDESVDSYPSVEALSLDQDTWQGMKSNDPDITSVKVGWYPAGHEYHGSDEFVFDADWKCEGRYISSNTNVKTLTLAGLNEFQDALDDADRGDDMLHFLRGLSENRSIENLILEDCCFCGVDEAGGCLGLLSPFLKNNTHLQRLTFAGKGRCMAVRQDDWCTLANAISEANTGSLEEFTLHAGCTLDDKSAGDIISSLGIHRNLVKLCLDIPSIGKLGWESLGNMLQSPGCTLRFLTLSHCNNARPTLMALAKNRSLKKLHLNNMNDEAAAHLGSSLSVNETLKALGLRGNKGITPHGWISFSVCLQKRSSALTSLDIGHNVIDDEAMISLANALGGIKSLKKLDLRINRCVGLAGWQALASALRNLNSTLQYLNLENVDIYDEGAVAIARCLANNSSLKILDLSGIGLSSEGWRDFLDILQNPSFPLEKLTLWSNEIDDEHIPALMNALSHTSSLKFLDLGNNFFSIRGMQSLSSLLRLPCRLTELSLYCNTIDDEVVISFANALVGNSSLSVLKMDVFDENMTARAWNALCDALCDKTSIDAICNSNHTLHTMSENDDNSLLPTEVVSLLQLNRHNTKAEIKRQKILRYHFLGDSDNIEAIVGIDLTVLPVAASWIGRDDIGLPILYRVFQSAPSLFDFNRKVGEANNLKRKWVE